MPNYGNSPPLCKKEAYYGYYAGIIRELYGGDRKPDLVLCIFCPIKKGAIGPLKLTLKN
jgi:hypothetical protein